MTRMQIDDLLKEIEKLHARHELAGNVGANYFEPGMMEYLEQSDGHFDSETGEFVLSFESRGTRYEGRTERIEKVNINDEVRVTREETNTYNHNNFLLLTNKGQDIGCMPAELCNVIAPLYDEGSIVFEEAMVSYVEPISKRNRHAKQAVLFVKVRAKVKSESL